MINIHKMASFMKPQKCREGMVNAIKVDGHPKNLDFAEVITKCKNKYTQEEKEIKHVFNDNKDQNKISRKKSCCTRTMFLNTTMFPSSLHMFFTRFILVFNFFFHNYQIQSFQNIWISFLMFFFLFYFRYKDRKEK